MSDALVQAYHPSDISLVPQGTGHDIGAFEYGTIIFADGFESGQSNAWSLTVGG